MALLNRDAILAANDVATTDVEVPEWGGSIRVRSMTVAEQNEFAKRVSADDKSSVGAWLMSKLAIDDHGSSIFKPEDIAELEKKNAKAVGVVVDAILRVNKIGEKEVDAAEKS
jgi:hypothetical protein